MKLKMLKEIVPSIEALANKAFSYLKIIMATEFTLRWHSTETGWAIRAIERVAGTIYVALRAALSMLVLGMVNHDDERHIGP